MKSISETDLSKWFLETLSPAKDVRRAAKRSLSSAAELPNYGLIVLRLVADDSVECQTRHAAAINFNEHLRSRWLPAGDSGITPVKDSEKQQIKTRIVSLISSSPSILSKLSEPFAIIGNHEFPLSWPELLPELISCLQNAALAGDYLCVNGILRIANSLFGNFIPRADFLYPDDYKNVCKSFAPPLQEVFMKTASLLDSNASSGGSEMINPLISSQKLCCELFFSLNYHHLPGLFKDRISVWMLEFRECLSRHYPSLETSSAGVADADDLRAAVCKAISLCVRKHNEEIKDYLTDFASDLVTLVRDASKSDKRDQLLSASLGVLTEMSRASKSHKAFSGEMVKEMWNTIVLPNVSLRHRHEEISFEPGRYTHRKDMVMTFFTALSRNYAMSDIILPEINYLWSDDDLRSKGFVVDLRSKVDAVDLMTRARGISSKDTEKFLLESVLPVLNDGCNSPQILLCVCMKHISSSLWDIRKIIVIEKVLPSFIGLIRSASQVVNSYAAEFIKELLLVDGEGGYVAGDIKPFVLELLENLFYALKFPASKENDDLMSCMIRVLRVAEISGEIARPCVKNLAEILSEICKNPENTTFNYFMCKSVAVLIRRACAVDMSVLPELENALFPSLRKMISASDIKELVPYAFDLLALLVKVNRPPLGEDYIQIFLLLLSRASWTKSEVFPALVGFLRAVLQKAPHEVTQENRLYEVLGIFQMLVSSSSTEKEGFELLNAVFEYVDATAIAPYITEVWRVLFERHENETTVELQKLMVITMSLFSLKHGATNLVDTINSVEQNKFFAILDQLWIPNLKLITGTVEVKLSVVAATRLLSVGVAPPDPAAPIRWGKMLDSTVALVSRPEEEEEITVDETEMLEISQNVGWAAAMVNLQRGEEEPLNCIKDTKSYLVAALDRLTSAAPGTYPQIISENLEEANQGALVELCKFYNCKIV